MAQGQREEGRRSSRWRILWAVPAVMMAASLVWLMGCASAVDPWANVPGEPRIVVTIPPLYSFVRAVAGDGAAIQCLCTTTGPHHYETDTREARLLDRADLFFAIGLQLDDKFSNALTGLARRNNPHLTCVKLGDQLPRKMIHKMRQHKHEKGETSAPHTHGELDPHVWLGMEQVIATVGQIRDELVKVDEKHADTYKKNADAFIKKMRTLHQDGRKMFEAKKVKRIISFHDALEYFSDSFGLTIADVIETGPGDNPTQRHLARLVELCRKEGPIGAITVEPQYPETSSAGQVQRELRGKGIKIEMVTVDPLETAVPEELHSEGASWYEKRMRQNLKSLADVLK
jgi:ABC-type Zn uptake system ZnuABC Zn-binding protein ZnuA